MIAEVVPITRIRRDTTTWSYLLPSRSSVLPGCLVMIPFRGHPTLGIVWGVEEKDEKAKVEISAIITKQPLLRRQHRQLVEYLSQIGLCSLSTALYQWLPRALRGSLTKETRRLLSEHDLWKPDSTALATIRQHAVLSASRRYDISRQLKKRFSEQFIDLFDNKTPDQELTDWLKIARGELIVGFGRESALFAPWANLRQLTIIQPEDIFYYHEQTPYLNLILPAQQLANSFQARLSYRSYLPEPVAQNLWGESAAGQNEALPPLELVNLRTEPLLGPDIVQPIKETLASGKKVLILYNARDRIKEAREEGKLVRKLIPGMETLGKRLAMLLEMNELPREVIFGTRGIFQQTHTNVGLCIALSLDPLLDQSIFSDLIDGWADLGHLFSYQCPCILQAHELEHPLIQALANKRLAGLMQETIKQQQALSLPPFGQQLVIALPESPEASESLHKLHSQLSPLLPTSWQLGHPLQAFWHKKPYLHLILHTPSLETRLPTPVRSLLIALPRPWKLLHNPGYLF